jgi:hypothetical protein
MTTNNVPTFQKIDQNHLQQNNFVKVHRPYLKGSLYERHGECVKIEINGF